MNPTVRFADTSPFRGGTPAQSMAPLKGELSLKATEGSALDYRAVPGSSERPQLHRKTCLMRLHGAGSVVWRCCGGLYALRFFLGAPHSLSASSGLFWRVQRTTARVMRLARKPESVPMIMPASTSVV